MTTREKELSRVTFWGAVANIVLALLKLVAGIVGRSSAMIADAVHSLSDLVSDVVVLTMIKISSKGSDKGHDYGHGKFETLATTIVALLLVVVGAKMMAEGVETIREVVGGRAIELPGKIALMAALVSIAVKEALYQWTARTGQKNNSPALITNAWHHRTDALSSIAAAVGIGAAIAFGGHWVVLDPVVSCLISLFIIYVAVRMAIPALNELTEGSLPDDVEHEITTIIARVEGVLDVHALKTRRSGPDIIIEAHVVVNPLMTVEAAHRITVVAESLLRQQFGPNTQISIHIEPSHDAE